MQGQDVERVLLIVNQIKDTTALRIQDLLLVSDYRMETIPHSHNVHVESSDGAHGHPNGAHHHSFWLTGRHPTGRRGLDNHVSDQLTYPEDYYDDAHPTHKHIEHSMIYEKQHQEIAMKYTAEIIALGQVLNADRQKMEKISDDMYTDKHTFHNAYGSPWTEVIALKQKIGDLEDYTNQHSTLQWRGEKFSLLNLMQIVLSFAIDAKFALMINSDFVQRGYDDKFHDKNPSMEWDDFKHGGTIGNRNQNSKAVNVKRKTTDPY